MAPDSPAESDELDARASRTVGSEEGPGRCERGRLLHEDRMLLTSEVRDAMGRDDDVAVAAGPAADASRELAMLARNGFFSSSNDVYRRLDEEIRRLETALAKLAAAGGAGRPQTLRATRDRAAAAR